MSGSLNERLGEVLRRARVSRHLTLRDVGTRSKGHFSPTTVAGYERGERAISLPRFCELAEIYGLRPDRLLREALGDSVPRPFIVDLSAIEALTPGDAQMLQAFVDRVVALRREPSEEPISLRVTDLEILAGRIADRSVPGP